MRDGFTAVGTVVDHDPKSRGVQAFGFCHALRHEYQVTEKALVRRGGFGDPRDFLLWDDQEMDRRLRVDVVEGETSVILENDPGGNFAGDDPGENRTHLPDIAAKAPKGTQKTMIDGGGTKGDDTCADRA